MPRQVTFTFRRAELFRTVYLDGVYGGLTGAGLVSMYGWIQRGSLPTAMSFAVGEDGVLGPEVHRETDGSQERQVEVELMLLPNIARSVGEWLIARAEEAEALTRSKRDREAMQ